MNDYNSEKVIRANRAGNEILEIWVKKQFETGLLKSNRDHSRKKVTGPGAWGWGLEPWTEREE